jgi:2-methylfumaryl-CoA hydratase
VRAAKAGNVTDRRGNFFEDFLPGQVFRHAVPRTLTDADAALYIALTGDRNPLYSSAEFARSLGLRDRPLHDLLVFHVVFAKSVADISLNAVANLGYAELRFLSPVYACDTLRAESTVLGLRQVSSGDAGIVWVRTTGFNQHDAPVLSYVRWVLVQKRDPAVQAASAPAPTLAARAGTSDLIVPAGMHLESYPAWASGSERMLEDFSPGQHVDHVDGMTLEEAEHALATRLYQNNARLHFDARLAASGRFGKRLVYGGHVISLARALSFNGLENALCCLAWDAGTHSNPVFHGDTIYAWSEVLEVLELPGRADVGALRLRLLAAKNQPPAELGFRAKLQEQPNGRETYHPNLVLDLEHVLLMPRRAGRAR